MWVIQLYTADWVWSKTQILLVSLKTRKQLQNESCAFSEVEHLFPKVGCARSKHQCLTVQRNQRLFSWMLVCEWTVSMLLLGGMWCQKCHIHRITYHQPTRRSLLPKANPEQPRETACGTMSITSGWRENPKIQIKYFDTRSQLADLLTTGSFTLDELCSLLCLVNIMNLSMFIAVMFVQLKRRPSCRREFETGRWKNELAVAKPRSVCLISYKTGSKNQETCSQVWQGDNQTQRGCGKLQGDCVQDNMPKSSGSCGNRQRKIEIQLQTTWLDHHNLQVTEYGNVQKVFANLCRKLKRTEDGEMFDLKTNVLIWGLYVDTIKSADHLDLDRVPEHELQRDQDVVRHLVEDDCGKFVRHSHSIIHDVWFLSVGENDFVPWSSTQMSERQRYMSILIQSCV